MSFFHKKNVTKYMGHHYAIWASDSIFYWPSFQALLIPAVFKRTHKEAVRKQIQKYTWFGGTDTKAMGQTEKKKFSPTLLQVTAGAITS